MRTIRLHVHFIKQCMCSIDKAIKINKDMFIHVALILLYHFVAVKWVSQARQKVLSFRRSHVKLHSLDQKELEVRK